jgi:hypothetical protein
VIEKEEKRLLMLLVYKKDTSIISAELFVA